ncbi:uncharacterized protein EI90DRAFT_3019546 [Cantharellus anzutake]|uniref:uncharacterized protein n=1 Tax=Cantharellus anzutake TaxID=1750568 RepID=UPI00190694B3|nr:uncharacterized protein EI90DRAFT_3019546 [Cantharellus anzutake]KAF8324408.1 hypothetical protein EI90DRAFT_3019546 [Cantharellus anzutake]
MDALKNLSTLHDFYAKLEVAKDEEVDTHHILLEPKGGSQLIQIASPGYNDILEMDPDANANAGISAYRNQADIISTQCSIILGYKWRYHDTQTHARKEGEQPALHFRYWCAQDRQLLQKSRKINDSSKQWDRQTIAYFECKSHLHITIQPIQGILTAKIDIMHIDDHIPYCATHLPPEARDIIEKNKDKSLKDVWHLTRQKSPTTPFSHDSKLDPDPIISSRAHLMNAEAAADGTLQMIDLGENSDYECIAFSIPAVLELWGKRIRELVMDSTWKCATGNSAWVVLHEDQVKRSQNQE